MRGIATAPLRTALCGAVALLVASLAAARAQGIDVERPHTLIVGGVREGCRTERVDAARTGRARTALPASHLRMAWSLPMGALIERPPVVDAQGTSYIVGARGEAVAVSRDGTEQWRLATSSAEPGPPALLSDDTLVFADASGQAVAVRDGSVRWKTRFGRNDAQLPAPVPLDDGGVVVGTSRDLAMLDARGRERARVTLPEETAAPLLSALGKILAVSTRGTIWAWSPGATEPTRLGSFGSAVDGAAALADDHTLVAVTNGQTHVTAVDLRNGAATTRAGGQGGQAGLWIGPPALRGPTLFVLAVTPSSEFAVGLDAAGRELGRSLIASHASPLGPDGGPSALVPDPRTPPLVDSAGTMAFATPDGRIGVAVRVAEGESSVELLTAPCTPGGVGSARGGPVVAGLAPLGTNALLAVCRSGIAFAVSGGEAAPQPSSGEQSPRKL